MFRRLMWVILTLLLSACMLVWVASYWHYSKVYWMRQYRDCGVGADRGLAALWVNREWADWAPSDGWHFEIGDAFDREWVGESDSVLGFGLRPGLSGAMTFQVPMWAVTLIVALPQLARWPRLRQSRKIGFPVFPVAEKKMNLRPSA